MKNQLETNKTTVRDFYNLAMNLKKPGRGGGEVHGALLPSA